MNGREFTQFSCEPIVPGVVVEKAEASELEPLSWVF
jgi:hypothetical protein